MTGVSGAEEKTVFPSVVFKAWKSKGAVMRKLAMLVVFSAFSLFASTEYLEFRFGSFFTGGYVHGQLFIARDMGRPVFCRLRSLREDEKGVAFAEFGEVPEDGMKHHVVHVEGVGKIFFFCREFKEKNGEFRRSGVAYLLKKDGWEEGRWKIKSLGWED